MTAASLYTRRLSGIDYRVWIVMLLTCLLCLGFYGYRQMQINPVNTQPCSSTSITVNNEEGKALALNRIYIFKIQTDANAKVEWEFDGVKGNDNGQIVQHKFAQEGIKKVVAKVNGRCKFEKEVTVRDHILLPLEKPFFDIVTDSTNLKAGSTVTFALVTNQQVNSYEWKWLEGNEVQQNKIGEFTFNSAGKYTVQLMVNNDPSNIISTKIDVTQNPLPEVNFNDPNPGNLPTGKFDDNVTGLFPPGSHNSNNKQQQSNQNQVSTQGEKETDKSKEEPPKAEPTKIDDESFKGLLQEVLNGEKKIGVLEEYLYYKEETIVVEGNKRKKIEEFYEKRKKKKIKSLKLKKDEHGIQQIIVEMKGWSPFG